MGNGIIKVIKYLFECVLEVVFSGDDKCIICSADAADDIQLCMSCSDKIMECSDIKIIEYNETKIKCYSAAYYSKTVRELVIRLKYKKDYKSAEILAGLMIKALLGNNISADLITFVPVSKTTLKKRGYNQSQLLGRLISGKTGIKLISTLEKSETAKDQIGLGKKGRMENIKGSFRPGKKIDIRNKSLILVDDVITTGATAFCCADILIKNGAKEVMVLTAAKSKV